MSNPDTSRLELNTKTNSRLFERNIASRSIQPYFSVSPVNTKYSVLGAVDVRKTPTEPLLKYPTFSQSNTFNPATRPGPWSGYSSNINNESILRNQVYALQRSDQSEYVPSSSSDLFNPVNLNTNTNALEQQPFSLLFKETQFASADIMPHDTHHMMFSNHTRQQLNEVSEHLPPINNSKHPLQTQGQQQTQTQRHQ